MELLLLKIPQAEAICMEGQPPQLLIMEQTLLTIKVQCLQEVCMDSLPPICHLLILVQWDKECPQPTDQVSRLFMVDNHLSTRQLEVLA